MTAHPADLTIAEAGAALRAGTLTAHALVQAHLDRIAARDRTVGAFVHLDPETVLTLAARADQQLAEGTDLGPLHGIPFAIKDVFDVAGWPVRGGSALYKTRIAQQDATVVDRLRTAGAIPLGLVASYELATVGPDPASLYPQPVNPWSGGHATGGSSSGSAAAVAAGLVRLSLASDTGGSARSPAAYCGVTGLKPGTGRVPAEGMLALAPSLDQPAVIARTAHDAAMALAALTDQPVSPRPVFPCPHAPLAGKTLAYGRGWAIDPAAHEALLSVLDAAASSLSLGGAAIRLVDLPPYDAIETAGADILRAEAFKTHGPALTAHPEAIGPLARAEILAGRQITAARLRRARACIEPLQAAIDTVLRESHALILPTTLTPAPRLTDIAPNAPRWSPMRTIPFNLTGHPALSVPMGFADGLPLGLQIIGRPGTETDILQIAAAFEAATDHSTLQPVFT
ncbi:MAG: amidase [Qingshengfaniella sp.]